MSDIRFPTPGNFPYDKVLYSDWLIAFIYGKYNGDDHLSLGMRWLVGETPKGYPSSRGNGMWLVVPANVAIHILKGLLVDGPEGLELFDEVLISNAIEDLEKQLGGTN
jgi:hypothetical protein